MSKTTLGQSIQSMLKYLKINYLKLLVEKLKYWAIANTYSLDFYFQHLEVLH